MRRIIVILAFALFAAACAGNRSRPNGGTEVWTVASEMVDCIGVGPQKCLLIKPPGETRWQFLYGGISGFDYEPGFEYVISVHRIRVENPPMDASSVLYVLDRVISKERKDSEAIPDTSHMFE
ncbi:MAG: DUF4377 domain-containing protein [Rikenellaceae bacterium]|nr:DUF4377 domain-containing protein [Rikenellaceae bacterium]